jgi:hypothetical protein
VEKQKKLLEKKMQFECGRCKDFVDKKDIIDEHGVWTHKGCGGRVRILKPVK